MTTKEERELWNIIHKQAEHIGRLQGTIICLINVAKLGSDSEDPYTKGTIERAENVLKKTTHEATFGGDVK